MMKQIYFILAFMTFSMASIAQTAKIEGRVTDEKGEGLIQVNVIIDASKGIATVTDYDGNYELPAAAGSYDVIYRYVGKEEQKIKVSLKEGEKVVKNIVLVEKARLMDQVVVSSSKYEKKLSEETVSMDVMKSTVLNNQNVTSLDNGVQKIPGVTIADGQANIRAGSGWSYGAGSRVAILYDDLPITTADADDAKWSVIPMENIDQVEVIKGAASSLYGSGALNGIINARSAYPTDQPFTKVQTYVGFYEGPTKTSSMKWWKGKAQYTAGVNFADRRKVGQWDILVGGAYNNDQSYLDSADNQDVKLHVKIRYRFKKVEGLSIGMNAIGYYSWGKTFFVWDSSGSKGYEPLPGTITIYNTARYILDPFVNYYDKHDNKFTFRARYLNSSNMNTSGQGSIGNRFYMEFQYQKQLKKIDLNITTGAVGIYDKANSPATDTASLIGNHTRANFAVFAQVDKKFFKRLNVVVGARWEYFNVDNGLKNSIKDLPYPLFRAGLNYQAAEATFIRGSFGQGFRYPSLAELFVQTRVGPIGVYSNPNLKPEKGYSGEIGIKQGFKFGKNSSWMGYADLAGFINYYDNMMEFTFGQFGNAADRSDIGKLFGVGFSSQNVGKARILGTELLLAVQGKVGNMELNLAAGYTFTDARSLNFNDRLNLITNDGDTLKPTGISANGYNAANKPNHDNQAPSYITYGMTSSSSNNLLKYRPRHQVKLVFGASWKKFDVGADYQYLSYQENIDFAFVSPLFSSFSSAFAGLRSYRAMRETLKDKGDHILNLSFAYRPIPKFKMALIVKNVLNTEWMPRPGRFEAPRNFTLQFGYTF